MMFKNLFLTAAEAVTEAVSAAEAVVSQTESASFMFEPLNFIANLNYMGLGMLAIFIVIAVIIGVVSALDILVRAFTVKLPKSK